MTSPENLDDASVMDAMRDAHCKNSFSRQYLLWIQDKIKKKVKNSQMKHTIKNVSEFSFNSLDSTCLARLVFLVLREVIVPNWREQSLNMLIFLSKWQWIASYDLETSVFGVRSFFVCSSWCRLWGLEGRWKTQTRLYLKRTEKGHRCAWDFRWAQLKTISTNSKLKNNDNQEIQR